MAESRFRFRRQPGSRAVLVESKATGEVVGELWKTRDGYMGRTATGRRLPEMYRISREVVAGRVSAENTQDVREARRQATVDQGFTPGAQVLVADRAATVARVAGDGEVDLRFEDGTVTEGYTTAELRLASAPSAAGTGNS